MRRTLRILGRLLLVPVGLTLAYLTAAAAGGVLVHPPAHLTREGGI